jgi:histidine triad (HIT) family protein
MGQDSCIFCGISKKEIPSTMLYEDHDLVAFRDIHPKAPVHFLVVPKKHVEDHLSLDKEDCHWIGKAHLVANQLAKDLNIADGFRIVINCKEKAGQTVEHFHMHVMGGRIFSWPPG